MLSKWSKSVDVSVPIIPHRFRSAGQSDPYSVPVEEYEDGHLLGSDSDQPRAVVMFRRPVQQLLAPARGWGEEMGPSGPAGR